MKHVFFYFEISFFLFEFGALVRAAATGARDGLRQETARGAPTIRPKY